MPRPPRQLDTRIEIVTPENIAFHYVVAGPFRRLPAYLFDCVLRLVMIVGVGIAAAAAGVVGAGGLGVAAFFISWFLLSWFYGGLFEALWNGQTPGKRLLRLRVLSVDGQPINARQAILRNLLRDVDALPLIGYGAEFVYPLYMLGLAVMAMNDRFQRLGDLASGTIVVIEQRSALGGLASLEQEGIAEIAQSLPAGLVVRRALAQSLSVYVARRRLFSPARRQEIARTLAEPLRERWGLPADRDPDALLCALYYRAFVADRPEASRGVVETAALAEAIAE